MLHIFFFCFKISETFSNRFRFVCHWFGSKAKQNHCQEKNEKKYTHFGLNHDNSSNGFRPFSFDCDSANESHLNLAYAHYHFDSYVYRHRFSSGRRFILQTNHSTRSQVSHAQQLVHEIFSYFILLFDAFYLIGFGTLFFVSTHWRSHGFSSVTPRIYRAHTHVNKRSVCHCISNVYRKNVSLCSE